MKHEGDKLLKILLKNGMAVHMYADEFTINELKTNSKFAHFRDDGNEDVCISIDAMAGFEVLDERTDAKKVEEVESEQESK